MERQQNSDEPKITPEQRERLRSYAKELRHNPAFRVAGNIMLGLMLIYFHSATNQGRKLLANPEYRKMLMDREQRTGLLEDTIIAPVLTHPNEEGTALTKSDAVAGRWASFDFRRPKEFFPKKVKQTDKGRLLSFILPEIIDNSPDKFTPTFLLNIFDISHFITAEFSSISDLLQYGYLKEVTYAEAYKNAGLYEKYSKSLMLSGIHDQTIYQVTPKGNGLVFLATDQGQNTEEKRGVKKFVPKFGTT